MVKPVQKTVYVSFDGVEHETEAEARAHEDEHFAGALVGLTEEQVAAALKRDPEALTIANAMERAGVMISKLRLASGERRRAAKGEGKAAETSASPSPMEPDPPPSAAADDELPD